MRIKQVKLKEFKRFDNLNIELGDQPKKIVAIVGPNGCGKSSVFDAFVEKIKDYKRTKDNPSQYYYSKNYYSVDPELKKIAYNKNNSIIIIKDDNTSNFNKKSFYFRSPYRFTSKLNIDNIRSLPDIAEDTESPGSSSSIDSRLQQNYERLLGNFFSEVYGKEITGSEWVVQNIQKINDILERILDIKISYLGDPTKNKAQLYFEKETSKDFPFENLSSGEKEVVDIVIDLLMKNEEFNETVYCIDEPELHLNTKIQRKLLIEIEKIIPDNCQLWVATHSVGFLRALQGDLREQSCVLDFSQADYFNGEKSICPIKPTRDNWKRIFETALEDLTGLLAPETIVYCEGRKDPDNNGGEQGFDAIVYNEIFSEEYPDVLFVSSGGNTELEKNSEIALKILNKAFDDVTIIILKDKDINSNGDDTTNTQREEWLQKDLNSRRMLKRREIENYLYDFEIISKAYPVVTQEKYNTLITDINNQNVKDITSDVMTLCGLNNVSKNDFKNKLVSYLNGDTAVYQELKNLIF